MTCMIYGESVQGASHIRNGISCQDSFKKDEIFNNVSLIAVADGHGSASCPYSKTGSVIATNVFCKVIKDMFMGFKDNMDLLLTYLNREGEIKVAQAIDLEWKKRVWKVHTDNKREKSFKSNGEVDKTAIYRQYGTTLLGLVITTNFVFAFQLGDGNIMYVDSDGVKSLIEGEKILGTETHSLSKADSWKNALTMIRMRNCEENMPYLYLIATDGFANSYQTEDDFHKTCNDYFDTIQNHGFKVVESNLKEWLHETSELGCGDDITLMLIYFNQNDIHSSRLNLSDI